MGRPQLVPYARITDLFIEAVAMDLPPVKTCAEILDVDHARLERRLEDVRKTGWLPPGQASNTSAWLGQARSLRAAKMAEQEAAARARLEQEVRRRAEQEKAEHERQVAADRRKAERTLARLHERRARAARRAQLREERRLERETARHQRRLEREASWRTPEEWAEQFWARVDVGDADACWPWTGRLNEQGYGQVSMHDGERDGRRYFRSLGVHRAAWLTLRGPIEPGLTLDHVCHNVDLSCAGGPSCLHRRCCNPRHLDPVPTELNSARGRGGANFRDRTHCSNGHDFAVHGRWFQSKTSTYPHRVCDECIREKNARAYARKMAERQAERAPVLDVFVGA